MKQTLETLLTSIVFLLVLVAAGAEARAESSDASPETLKLHVGFNCDLMMHSALADGRMNAGGVLPIIDVGLGRPISEHVLVAGQATAALAAWRVGLETRFSVRGWRETGPMLWSGLHFADMGVDCGDSKCPDDEHFGFEVWGRGAMLSLGAGYRWPFEHNQWAVGVGVGSSLSYLWAYTPGDEPLSSQATRAITGWYTGLTMLRGFIEY